MFVHLDATCVGLGPKLKVGYWGRVLVLVLGLKSGVRIRSYISYPCQVSVLESGSYPNLEVGYGLGVGVTSQDGCRGWSTLKVES